MDSVDLVQWALDSVDGVQSWWSAGHPFPSDFASLIPTSLEGWVAPGLIGLFGLALWRMRATPIASVATVASENATARAKYQQPVALPKTGNRGRIDKARQDWTDPLSIGGITVEASQKHLAIGATTGARKTTIIANLIMQANQPVIAIAGDKSPYALEAMRARGWRVWSADGKNGGLFVLEGTPNQAAQIATVLVYPPKVQTGTGLQLGMVRNIFRDAIQTMDDNGVLRSLPALADALYDAEPPRGLPNKNFDMAKANWISRIDTLVGDLGPALGTDISVVDCVRSECGLFFDLNAFSDLDLAQTFAEAAVRLTQHAADKTGKFWWVIDELSLFDADLLAEIVRTCRIRGVKFVGASQIISDFGKTLRGLVKCWFVGEQTAADHESRKWCSDLTMGYVPQENFAEHATPPGFYYVVADGRTQSLQIKPWHHPEPIAPVTLLPPLPGRPGFIGPLPVASPFVHPSASLISASITKTEVRAPDAAIEKPLIWGPVAMPACYSGSHIPVEFRGQLENIWQHHTFPRGLNGCYESTYHKNNRGRPRCSLDGADWTTYILARTLDDARLRDMTPTQTLAYMSEIKMRTASGELTVDHVEGCENEVCDRPDHTAWEGRGRNSELYHERRRDAVAA